MILNEAGDICNSTSTSKYCDERYGDLGMYVNKVLSAWTEVSIATWPSTERFCFPGVAIWADFEIFEILGGLVIYI